MKNTQRVNAEMIFPATVHIRLWKAKKSPDPDNPVYGKTYYVTLPREISPVEGEVLTLAIIARKPPPEPVQPMQRESESEKVGLESIT